MSKPKTHITIPFLKFMYHVVRKRKVKKNICVMGGGRMSEESYLATMEIVKNIQNGKQ